MTTPAAPARVELVVGGMTCTSCAARVERKLNRLEGVTATVNYATERAAVDYDPRQVGPAELIAVVEATGYTASRPEAESRPDPTYLRPRLALSIPLTIPVVLLAMVPALHFTGWLWVSLGLTTPVLLWGGWPFHRATVLNLRHRAATMDTLVSVGTGAAYAWSLYAVVADQALETYFDVAAVVTVFLLAGRYLEAGAKRRSGAALQALLDLGAKDVAVVRDGIEHRVPIEQLRVGEAFVVRPGEKVATDGVVQDGSSAIDLSLLTGESVPVEVGPGDEVTGATANIGGRLVVVATRVGADTRLARIGRLVTQAQSGKAPVQRLADRVAMIFVPVVIGLAVLTVVLTLIATGDAPRAFTAGVAVLIVACPCALGLATPTALLVGTGRGAQLGLLIKGPEVLESTRRADVVVLDKTGTVTTGQMTVHGVVAGAEADTAELLRVAGALESASEHPIGAAIAAAAGPERCELFDFAATAGLGLRGTVVDSGRTYHAVVGRPQLLVEQAIAVPDEVAAAAATAEAQGRTAVLVGWNGAARGVIVVGDVVKPTSVAAIAELRALGLRPMLLTGDNRRAAEAIAAEVGIAVADIRADARPEDKVAQIETLRGDGHVVAMVGDGVNDAAALAAADLGLAVGAGADVAVEASDLTLVRNDLAAAVDAIRLSRRTLATIKGNLVWAFGYNVVLIPVAALGWLNPMLAGAAMALSSLFVVTNSLRLRRFRGWEPAVDQLQQPLAQERELVRR